MAVLGTNIGRFIDPSKTLFPDGYIEIDFLLEETVSAVCYQRRYAGHAGDYSVGQHLLLLSDIWRALPSLQTGLMTQVIELKLLIHDLHEAYVVDLPRPIKAMLPEYGVLEKKVEAELLDGLLFGLFDEANQTKIKETINSKVVNDIVSFMDINICTLVEIPLFMPSGSSVFSNQKTEDLAKSGLHFMAAQMAYNEWIDADSPMDSNWIDKILGSKGLDGTDPGVVRDMIVQRIYGLASSIDHSLTNIRLTP